MFITHGIFRSPFASLLCGAEAHDWSVVELAVDHTWFLVPLVEPVGKLTGTHGRFSRTLLLAKPEQLVELVVHRAGVESNPTHISLIRPIHANGRLNWKLDSVSSLWEATGSAGANHKGWIFETATGTIVLPDGNKTSSELCNLRLIWHPFD